VRRLPILLAMTLLLGATAAAPAHALRPFDPPVEIIRPGCSFNDVAGDVVYGADGRAHGFATFLGGTCGSTLAVWSFEGDADGGSWTRAESQYQGVTLASAWDATGTYVLYQAIDGLRIGKREAGGAFSNGRRLSAHTVVNADLVARDGRWWGVWSETVGAGSRAQSELFQAGTLSDSPRARERITFHPLSDMTPTLALSPAADRMVLLWARGAERSELRSALGSFDGEWASRRFTDRSDANVLPDVAVTATTTFVAWQQVLSGQVPEADNQGGPFAGHAFLTPGFEPHVSFDGAVGVVGWTTEGRRSRAFVAERNGSVWSGQFASPAGTTRDQYLVGLVAEAGSVTAVVASIGLRLYATTES
jgi:hypothetical protein